MQLALRYQPCKYKMYSFRRKTEARDMMESSTVLKEIKGLKKNLIQNGKKGNGNLRQDPTHLILQSAKGTSFMDVFDLETNNSKLMQM